MPNCTKCGEFINTSVTWVTVCRFCQAGGVATPPVPAKPTVAQDAIATADSYLQNAVLPTYSELLQALQAMVEQSGATQGMSACAPRLPTVHAARALLARHDKTMAGNFGG